MAHLKMTQRPVTPVKNPVWIEPLVTIAAEQNGDVPSGRRSRRARREGREDRRRHRLPAIAKLQDDRAPEAGIVMFIRAVPSLKKGDTIVSIGVVRKGMGRAVERGRVQGGR